MINILFALVATALIAVAIRSMKKQKSERIELTSSRVDEALNIIKIDPDLHRMAQKYDYTLTRGLTVRGQQVGAIAWYGRGLVEIDYDFISTADIKTIVSTLLHEIAHLELGHTIFSPINENAAIDWQLDAMAKLYP